MKLLKMQGDFCLVYSLAMLLDEKPDVLLEELGHDGLDKWWPKHDAPHCFRGHHMQEIIDVCLWRGYGLVPIEFFPRTASARDPTDWKAVWGTSKAIKRFRKIIKGRPGILIGEASGGSGHACAWDGHIVFDPNGRKYPISEFRVSECWLLAITSEIKLRE